MKYEGAVLFAAGGKEIPQGTIERMVEAYPDAISITAPNKATNTVLSAAALKDGDLSIEKLLKIQAKFKDGPVIVYLGKAEKFHKEDIPPFTLLKNAEGKPILSVILEGDFDRFTTPESAHSGAFFAASTYLFDKIKTMHDSVGGDLGKLVGLMNNPVFEKECQLMTGVLGGTILFLTGSGIVKTIRGERGAKHTTEYGWASHIFRDTTPKPAEKAAAPAAPVSDVDAMLADGDVATPTKTPVESAHGNGKPVADPNLKKVPEGYKPFAGDDSKVVQLNAPKPEPEKEGETYVELAPPVGTTKQQKMTWYALHIGNPKPHNFKNGVKVKVPFSKLQELKYQLHNGVWVAPEGGVKKADPKVAPPAAAITPPKTDTAATPVANDNKPAPKPVPPVAKTEDKGGPFPIISKEDRKAFVDTFMTGVEAELIKPELIAPSFSEQLGISIERLYSLKYPRLLALAKKHPDIIAIALIEFQDKYAGLAKTFGDLKKLTA